MTHLAIENSDYDVHRHAAENYETQPSCISAFIAATGRQI